VTGGIIPFTGNLTMLFDFARPDNSTIHLTCTDQFGATTTGDILWGWPSVIPASIMVKAVPGQTVDGSNTDFSSYDITIL
jgi:hypothetical protein